MMDKQQNAAPASGGPSANLLAQPSADAGQTAERSPAGFVFPPRKGVLRLLLPRSDADRSVTISVNGREQVYSPDLQAMPAFELLNSDRKPDAPALLISNNAVATAELSADPKWTLDGHLTYRITQSKNIAQTPVEVLWVDPSLGRLVPVCGGAPLVFCVHYALHRCSGWVHLRFIDADRQAVSLLRWNLVPGKTGGRALADYAFLKQSFVVPENAAFVEISILRSATDPGHGNSNVFFTCLSLGYEGREPEVFADLPGIESFRHGIASLLAGGAVSACIPLPRLPSNMATSISVHTGVGRIEAVGSPLLLPEHAAVNGRILGVQGTSVHGEVDLSIHSYADPSLYAYVDGVFHGACLPVAAETGATTFAIALSSTAFDGRVHLISLQSSYGETIAEWAAVLPFCATPWDVSVKYTGSPSPVSMTPLTAMRADSLRGHLNLLSEAMTDSESVVKSRIAALHAAHETVSEGRRGRHSRRKLRLEFPIHDRPRVSVVISAHQDWERTLHCLASLLLAPNRTSYEVILVDGGVEGFAADRIANIVVVTQKIPLGRYHDHVVGAAKARGEYLAFLNSEAEVGAWWLDQLLAPFGHFENVGITGAKLINPDGSLQCAGGRIWASGAFAGRGQNQNPHDPRYNYTRPVDFVSVAALLLPASLWKKVGGFSPEFTDEAADIDLAFKAKATGTRTVYAPGSLVVIDGENGDETAGFQAASRHRLQQKWAPLLEQFGSNDAGQEDAYGSVRKALVIDHAVPDPSADAGSHAAVQEMRALTALGYHVTLAPENPAYTGEDTEYLQGIGVEVLYAPFMLSVSALLESRGAEFDLIYIGRYHIAQKYIDLVRLHAPQAKLVFCSTDLHFLREMREASAANTVEALAYAENTRYDELALCEKADLVLAYSDAELAVLTSCGIPVEKTALCRWVVESPEQITPFQDRDGIAFVGGFADPPTAAAIRWFASEVMPLVHASHPQINLHIFGSELAAGLKEASKPGFVVEPHSGDAVEVYERCRVFVAPLLTGAGLKGKVIGAFARGAPTVLSTIAVESTGALDGRDCIVAEHPAAWADAIISLYTDESRWDSLSRASQNLARTRYSFEQGKRAMAAALQKLGGCEVSAAADKLRQPLGRSKLPA